MVVKVRKPNRKRPNAQRNGQLTRLLQDPDRLTGDALHDLSLVVADELTALVKLGRVLGVVRVVRVADEGDALVHLEDRLVENFRAPDVERKDVGSSLVVDAEEILRRER